MGKNSLTADIKTLSAKYINTGKVNLTSTIYNSVSLGVGHFYASTGGGSLTMFLNSTGTASTSGVAGWALDATAMEWIYFGISMPTDYKEGTSITPYIHYLTTGSTGSAQSVAMALTYAWTNQDGLVATPTQSNLTLTPGTAFTVYTTNFTALSSTSAEVGSHLMGCLVRNSTAAADSYTADLYVTGMDFYYQVDGFGSSSLISDK